jgi:hypothetical protein
MKMSKHVEVRIIRGCDILNYAMHITSTMHISDLILRALDCIVIISFGVRLVLWLFQLVLWCVGVCLRQTFIHFINYVW